MDGALRRLAEKLVKERATGLGSPDPDRVVALLREHGEPHVRPRVLSATARSLDDAVLEERIGSLKRSGSRCGVAVARTTGGEEAIVAVVVDARADLDRLPTRARTGAWLTLSATLHVRATSAKLVVLGPRGLPRTVPTSIDARTGKVQARFALDRPGAFTVQLVGDLPSGPEPLLEARVFADVDPVPADDAATQPVPGETASAKDADDLARMVTALRATESLPSLVRDERLDALAHAHVETMKAARAIAHDLGDGDLQTRLEAAGLAARVIGENVARARTLVNAHRALHASPSHRMNLLRADYTHVGLAVVTDGEGNVYVCQVFASALR